MLLSSLAFCVCLLLSSLPPVVPFGKMIRGVGLYRAYQGKNAKAAVELEQLARNHVTKSYSSLLSADASPVRATLVLEGNNVVLVEEWSKRSDYDAYAGVTHNIDEAATPLVSVPAKKEFFAEALHICKATADPTIGILVRQKTSCDDNGGRLRDAQREAYERQMGLEPGCTCCIILANSEMDKSQVRIIELWKVSAVNCEFGERGE